jgi:hypothetical protein
MHALLFALPSLVHVKLLEHALINEDKLLTFMVLRNWPYGLIIPNIVSIKVRHAMSHFTLCIIYKPNACHGLFQTKSRYHRTTFTNKLLVGKNHFCRA